MILELKIKVQKLVSSLIQEGKNIKQIERAVSDLILSKAPNGALKSLQRQWAKDVAKINLEALRLAEEKFDYAKKISFRPEETKSALSVFEKITEDFAIVQGNIQKEVSKFLRESIRKNYSLDKIRIGLEDKFAKPIAQAYTIANTGLASYSNVANFEYAKDAGVKKFKYDGPSGERDFCTQHLGKLFTESEINRLNNGQGLPVKEYLGGWNCRHYWTPIIGE
jgi:hypothetical protein